MFFSFSAPVQHLPSVIVVLYAVLRACGLKKALTRFGPSDGVT